MGKNKNLNMWIRKIILISDSHIIYMPIHFFRYDGEGQNTFMQWPLKRYLIDIGYFYLIDFF